MKTNTIHRLVQSRDCADKHSVRVKLCDGMVLQGKVDITKPGVKSLAELFAESQPSYIVINECIGGMYEKNRTLFVNKTHIMWAESI
ncbi:Uncharacterized protein dnl_06760 [Desulfonema limicola]|uniref:Uncharacterized protein n=1 Tax=Desulfonema limicola TaxID=45656 RepID=A0A975B448_9BACT|nr:hypothetical protein [Desulfonema limicola]QTA78454.1 Uncharacterized protein dnl_06760 [Desulfonema limicola]